MPDIKLHYSVHQFVNVWSSAARFFSRKSVGMAGERLRKSVFFRRSMLARWRHKRTWLRCTCVRKTENMKKWWGERSRKSSLRKRSRLLTSCFCEVSVKFFLEFISIKHGTNFNTGLPWFYQGSLESKLRASNSD